MQRKQAKTEEDASMKQLHQLVETARKRNLRFLSIRDRWDRAAKAIFFDGVQYVCFFLYFYFLFSFYYIN